MIRRKVAPISQVILQSSPSKGPEELTKPESEFENFASADLDVKLLLALAKKDERISKLMCIPSYFATFTHSGADNVTFSHTRKSSSSSIRAGILISKLHTTYPILHIPDDMKAHLETCRNRNKRFVVFNTGLYWGSGRGGHANVIIFDIQNFVIERYEPAGKQGIINNLEVVFKEQFPEYTYVGPRIMREGAQLLSDSFNGMCVTFSLFYTLLRLTNPKETPRAVYEYIRTHEKKDLQKIILQLNKFAIETLKTLKRGSLDNVRTLSQSTHHSTRGFHMN